MIPDFSIYRLKSFLEALPMVVTCRRRVHFARSLCQPFFPTLCTVPSFKLFKIKLFSLRMIKSALGKNHWFGGLYTIVSFLAQITSSLLGILTIVLRFCTLNKLSFSVEESWLTDLNILERSTPVNSSGRVYLSLYKRLYPEI